MPKPLSPASLAPFWRTFRQYVARSTPADYSQFGHRFIPKIGLCISGGPDSMALAYLLSNHIKDKPDAEGLSRILGIIVDHNSRPGSGQEALMVQQWLKKMGIDSVVEKMDWEGDDPTKLTNFESQARVRRYRHLAVAARYRKIRHLFTGHHCDDQIETLLLRLIRGKNVNFLGLQGMQVHGPMPECEGYRGIRNDEPSVPLSSIMRDLLPGKEPYLVALNEMRLGQVLYTNNDNVRGLRHGGMGLHRPLLVFPKSDLIATCEANSIPFLRDKSNDDPTFTTRNAVRILRTKKLPRALQTRSLLSLVETAQTAKLGIEHRADRFLQLVSILTFDFRSGLAEIRIPISFANLAIADPAAAACVVAKLASLVSPTPADRRHTVAPRDIVSDLCRAMNSPYSSGDQNTLNRPMFTYDRVSFTGLRFSDELGTIWRISRLPMTFTDYRDNVRKFDLGTPNEKVASLVSSSYSSPQKYEPEPVKSNASSNASSRWLLWDFRYWIRVWAEHRGMLPHLQLRPYQWDDVNVLKEKLPEKDFMELQDILHRCAPGKVRHTLPILAFNAEIIAFPTLFTQMVNSSGFRERALRLGFGFNPELRWHVAYKILPQDISSWGSKVSTPYSTLVKDLATTAPTDG